MTVDSSQSSHCPLSWNPWQNKNLMETINHQKIENTLKFKKAVIILLKSWSSIPVHWRALLFFPCSSIVASLLREADFFQWVGICWGFFTLLNFKCFYNTSIFLYRQKISLENLLANDLNVWQTLNISHFIVLKAVFKFI